NPAAGYPPAPATVAVVAGCTAIPARGVCSRQWCQTSAASRTAVTANRAADGTPAAAVRRGRTAVVCLRQRPRNGPGTGTGTGGGAHPRTAANQYAHP